MEKKVIHSVYLGQSGFYLEFPEATLIFDWHTGSLPEIRTDKPLYIFISHVHSDHFNPEAFTVAANHPHAEVYLGYNRAHQGVNKFLDSLPAGTQKHLHIVDGAKKLASEDGGIAIRTLKSTDLGVAFLIGIAGQTVFHAGDLFLMQAMGKKDYMQWYADNILHNPGAEVEDYESYCIRCSNEFIDYTEPLRGKIIDYGMLPLDPRVEGVALKTILRYLDVAIFKKWSPMHLWGRYEFVDTFKSEHPDLTQNMLPFVRPDDGAVKESVIDFVTEESPEEDLAWGPQSRKVYSWERRADLITFNSIKNNPRIGDERNFVRVRSLNGDKKLTDSIDLVPGEIYEVGVWFHNDADISLLEQGNGTATGVWLRMEQALEVVPGHSGKIKGIISCRDASPSEIWDCAYMHAKEPVKIVLLTESAKVHSLGSINGETLPVWDMVGEKGVLLGYSKEKMGEVPAGNEFSGYVTYQFRAESK